MLKKILSVFLMLYAAASFAAVDANKANPASSERHVDIKNPASIFVRFGSD